MRKIMRKNSPVKSPLKVKEKTIKTRLFCRFKNTVLGAFAVVLSLVTPCGGHPPANSSSSDLVGRVVKVSDGDTITILDASKTQHTIRLQGIDAPEKGQAFGRAAGRYLAGLVAGRDVKVQWSKKDRYGRILGTVYVDGREVNLEMLRAGMAWHYKKYDSTPTYAQAETEARAAKRGLWQDKNPTEPEEFRKAKRAKNGGAP